MPEPVASTCAIAGAWNAWIMVLTLVVFDLGTALLLRWALRQAKPEELIREKAPEGRAVGDGETSYSRVAGVVGSVVIACFFWAFGNILIFRSFVDPTGQSVKALVEGVWPWLTGGAAMFLPYAVNQLRAVFK